MENPNEPQEIAPRKTRLTILPKTSWGWWPLGLVIVIILLFGGVLDHILALFGIVEVPSKSLLERNISIGFAVISTAAVATGLIGIIRRRERSILVFLTIVVGLFALIISLLQASGVAFGW
jgi:hypothetical protein